MNPQHHPNMPRLLGDIGGTNARFALVHGDQQPITHELTLPTGQYPDLAAAAQAYLQQVGQPKVAHACSPRADSSDGATLQPRKGASM